MASETFARLMATVARCFVWGRGSLRRRRGNSHQQQQLQSHTNKLFTF